MDEEQSRIFQEELRELLDGYDVGKFGEERFNLWAAKNPFLRPSFVRRLHYFLFPYFQRRARGKRGQSAQMNAIIILPNVLLLLPHPTGSACTEAKRQGFGQSREISRPP
jgi:hypothetical protein